MNPQVRPPIDPRIRQRRIAVRRQEGRRRLRLLVGLVSASGLLVGGWGATRSPLLDVDGIAVVGADRTSREELVAASGIRFGQAMVDVDERGAVRAMEALPWIRSVSVERRWPDSVVIRVVERAPVAVAPAADGWALVDATGQVLALLTSAPSNLLALDGIAPAGPPGSVLGGPAADLLAVAAAVPPDLRPRVERGAGRCRGRRGATAAAGGDGPPRCPAAVGGEVPGSTHGVGPGRHQRPRHPRRQDSREPRLDAPQPCG